MAEEKSLEKYVRELENMNLYQAKVRHEAKAAEAELLAQETRLTREIAAIIAKYGENIPPEEAKRLLRLLALRILLTPSPYIQNYLKALREVEGLFTAAGEPAPTAIVVEEKEEKPPEPPPEPPEPPQPTEPARLEVDV